MKETENAEVRGSPQTRGYVHQRVITSCDVYFIKKGITICNIMVAIPFGYSHRLCFREFLFYLQRLD